jgi:hypothetical protein
MENLEDAKYKLELLRMSRELLNEEYINKRAEDHNKWVADADVAWKTQGIKLPYPPFAPYPKESDIVAKALTLFNFLKSSSEKPAGMMTDVVTNKLPTASTELTKREIESVAKITKTTETPIVVDSPWATYLNTNNSSNLVTDSNASTSNISSEVKQDDVESTAAESSDVQSLVSDTDSEIINSKPLFASIDNQSKLSEKLDSIKTKNSMTSWFKKN